MVEVPLGITIDKVVYEIGGGPVDKAKIKAVQTGGPSGGCIPASRFDLPISYDSLKEAGSIMGSGGLIVMDENTCMVDVAKYFLAFLRDESCGKCTPCREGNYWMLNILRRMDHDIEKEDVDLLYNVAKQMQGKCLCALGEFATMAVVTGIERFPADFGK